jgi:predicted nuclease of predicted toxin-antitoxin system
MRIVADENIDDYLISILRQHGFEVIWIGEVALSIDDWEVLQRAFELDALLITEDKGISRDVFEDRRPTSGVLLLWVHKLTFWDRAKLVLDTIQENEAALYNKFSVLTNERLRVRPIPR